MNARIFCIGDISALRAHNNDSEKSYRINSGAQFICEQSGKIDDGYNGRIWPRSLLPIERYWYAKHDADVPVVARNLSILSNEKYKGKRYRLATVEKENLSYDDKSVKVCRLSQNRFAIIGSEKSKYFSDINPKDDRNKKIVIIWGVPEKNEYIPFFTDDDWIADAPMDGQERGAVCLWVVTSPGRQEINEWKNRVTQTADSLRSIGSNVIITVEGDALRKSGAVFSKRESWEETALNTVWQSRQNKFFRDSFGFARLTIVTFGMEGAVILDPEFIASNDEKSRKSFLWFCPIKMEGDILSEHPGYVPEAHDMLIFSIVKILENYEMDKCVEIITASFGTYMKASAVMHICGYDEKLHLNFNKDLWEFFIEKLNEKTKGDEPRFLEATDDRALEFFSDINFIKTEIRKDCRDWDITPVMEMFNDDPSILGNLNKLKKIVESGVLSAGLDCPVLKIGKLESIGRNEIEAFSAIKNLINSYIHSSSHVKPLSIAAFGQPGSGKSFGVKEIAKNIKSGTPCLEYNLAQQSDVDMSALYEAFHDIQDYTMKGEVPVVIFDEFDSNGLDWLKCFLMPMQDGAFIENGKRRPIGKCVFVFAGGRFQTYNDLIDYINPKKDGDQDQDDNEKAELFRMKKVPDFLSRIKGFVNIQNINPDEKNVTDISALTENADRRYIVKRAMLLSSFLEGMKEKHGRKIKLSDDVLCAMLYARKYEHGARSMEAVLDMCRIPPDGEIGVADLPSSEQLTLHVDANDFKVYSRIRVHYDEIEGRFAREIAKIYGDNPDWDLITDTGAGKASEIRKKYYKYADYAIGTIVKKFGASIGLCGDTKRVPKHMLSRIVRRSKMDLSIITACSRLFYTNYVGGQAEVWDTLEQAEKDKWVLKFDKILSLFVEDNETGKSMYLYR